MGNDKATFFLGNSLKKRGKIGNSPGGMVELPKKEVPEY